MALARSEPVTLLFSARDEERNNAVALAALLKGCSGVRGKSKQSAFFERLNVIRRLRWSLRTRVIDCALRATCPNVKLRMKLDRVVRAWGQQVPRSAERRD